MWKKWPWAKISDLAFALAVLAAAAFYTAGIPQAPFHPDESTYLYMSADLEALFSDPLSLAYTPDGALDRRERYRAIDTPLTRYLAGVGRLIAGLPAPAADWDWSKTWAENRALGSLPDQRALLASRYGLAVFFPLSLLCIYSIGLRLHGRSLGWIAALLLAGNALVLLHTRRVMAEAPLLFAMLLSLWSILAARRRPWLTAVPLALAFGVKQFAIGLVAVGLAAVLFPEDAGQPLKARLRGAVLFVLIFAGITALLNPFYWRYPLQAAEVGLRARAEFNERSADEVGQLLPAAVLDNPGKRITASLGNLFITRPAAMEVNNYQDEIGPQASAYLANPLHTLLRSTAGAVAVLTLCLGGMTAAGMAFFRRRNRRREVALLFLAGAAQYLVLLAVVSLPYQRYALPLVPFLCLWAGWGLARILNALEARG